MTTNEALQSPESEENRPPMTRISPSARLPSGLSRGLRNLNDEPHRPELRALLNELIWVIK